METGLSMALNDEGGDLVLHVTVALPPNLHGAAVYVDEGELHAQLAGLQRFLAQLGEPAPATSFELHFGPRGDGAPQCSVDIAMLRLGRAAVSVRLQQPYWDSNFQDTVRCTLHFSSEVALLDDFAADLAVLSTVLAGTAWLEPLEYSPFRE